MLTMMIILAIVVYLVIGANIAQVVYGIVGMGFAAPGSSKNKVDITIAWLIIGVAFLFWPIAMLIMLIFVLNKS